uniref:Putative secreted protein n=1 Tax=Ixodes ricinus TaxID=34613 RepID=A0A6B0U8P2_IXORI
MAPSAPASLRLKCFCLTCVYPALIRCCRCQIFPAMSCPSSCSKWASLVSVTISARAYGEGCCCLRPIFLLVTIGRVRGRSPFQ